MRPWLLADLTLADLRSRPPIEVAVLPMGATEPHNLHMPHGTDTFQVETIADLACQAAFERGARIIRLPAIPYGTETNMMTFPIAMNLNPTTVAAVITDLVASLEAHGIKKCLILNGHGGNDLKWVLRQLAGKTKVHLFLSSWYKIGSDQHKMIFQDAGDHAGELETSMGLAHFPSLVHLDRADEGSMRPSRFEAINKGWVEISRRWDLLTTNSGAGDPGPASAEKGRRLTEIVVDRLARFLVELSASPLDEAFPFTQDR